MSTAYGMLALAIILLWLMWLSGEIQQDLCGGRCIDLIF